MPTVRSGCVDIAFERRGEGDPIIWLPGTGLYGATWERHVEHFSRRWQCITTDLRGSGDTVGGGLQFSVADLAHDVAGLMDGLHVGRAAVVGLSLGSAVAQELALARPDLVSRLVLVATWSSTAREHHIRRHFESRLYALENGPLDVFAQFAFWMSSPSVVDLEPDLQARVEAELGAHLSPNLEGTAAHFRADLGHETLDRLGALEAPTLVVHGDEDLITLPRYNRQVAEAIPGARIEQVARAGHLVWLERPQQVIAHVEHFLTAH